MHGGGDRRGCCNQSRNAFTLTSNLSMDPCQSDHNSVRLFFITFPMPTRAKLPLKICSSGCDRLASKTKGEESIVYQRSGKALNQINCRMSTGEVCEKSTERINTPNV